MKKILILIIFIIFVSAFYYFSVNKISTKVISPYEKYASLIPHSYRVGFTNLDQEVSLDNLPIKGKIPSWLSGTLFRNGPAKFYTANSWVSNWFDGLAMIHAFSFDQGNVSYANKFLKSSDYIHVQQTGNMSYAGFVQDPCKLNFKKLFSWFLPKNSVQSLPNANVNIAKYADHFIALTETPLPIEFDPTTLKTIGGLDYADQLPHKDIHDTAHPHYDPVRKEHLGYFTRFGRNSTVNLFAIKDGTIAREVLVSMDVKEPSYMHSFAITEHYAVLTMIPLVVNPLDLLLKQQAFIKNFRWKPELGTTFVVIDRINNNVVGSYNTIPFFTFHHVNAFEKNNQIILDIVVYPDAQDIFESKFEYILSEHQDFSTSWQETSLVRFTVDLMAQKVTQKTLSDEYLELPRINYEQHNGKEYRYIYAYAQNRKNPHAYVADKLIKIDIEKNEVKEWSQPLCYPGEPVFIAAPNANAEDEGVVLSIILDAQNETSFLLVLDAKTFSELGRAEVPHHIPFGIHGKFITA